MNSYGVYFDVEYMQDIQFCFSFIEIKVVVTYKSKGLNLCNSNFEYYFPSIEILLNHTELDLEDIVEYISKSEPHVHGKKLLLAYHHYLCQGEILFQH